MPTSTAARLAKNSMWGILSPVVSMILVFFITPLYIEKLTAELYGIYVLIHAFVGPLAILELGLGEALGKYVAGSEAEKDLKAGKAYVNGAFIFNVSIGLLGGIFLLLFGLFFVHIFFNIDSDILPNTKIAFSLSGISFFLNRFISVLHGVLFGVQNFKLRSVLTSFQNILIYIGGLIAALLGHGIVGIIIFQICGQIVTIILGWKTTFKLVPHLYPSLSWNIRYFKEILKFGLWNTLGRIGSVLMRNVDKLAIGAFLTSTLVGYYNTANIVVQAGFMLIAPMSSVFMPYFSSIEKAENKLSLERKMLFSVWLFSSLIIIIYIPIFLLSHKLLSIWINTKCAETAAPILKILIVGACVAAPSLGLGQYLLGIGLPKYNTIYTLVRGGIACTVGVILIKIYGIKGAGLGFLLSQCSIIVLIGITWMQFPKRDNKFIHFIKACFSPYVCGCIVILLYSFININSLLKPSNLFSLGATYIALLLVTLFLFTIFNVFLFNEKENIKKVVRVLRNLL